MATVTLHHPVAFRALVERVAEVLPVIPIEVVRTEAFSGLRVHAIDRTAVACVSVS